MRLLTQWQKWWVRGRNEHQFHCDLILAPGERVIVYAEGGERVLEQIIKPRLPGHFVKVHLAASWEERDTEFA